MRLQVALNLLQYIFSGRLYMNTYIFMDIASSMEIFLQDMNMIHFYQSVYFMKPVHPKGCVQYLFLLQYGILVVVPMYFRISPCDVLTFWSICLFYETCTSQRLCTIFVLIAVWYPSSRTHVFQDITMWLHLLAITGTTILVSCDQLFAAPVKIKHS